MAKCPTCGREAPKTHDQRKKFHVLCKIIGDHVGLTPGKVKEAIKTDYFGIDEWQINGKWYRGVRPSESAQKAEYSDLINYTYQWAAENCELVLYVDA
jgi:hypothetical protein